MVPALVFLLSSNLLVSVGSCLVRIDDIELNNAIAVETPVHISVIGNAALEN